MKYCKYCDTMLMADLEFCGDACKSAYDKIIVFRNTSDKEKYIKYFNTVREMEAFVMGAEYANNNIPFKENENLKKENKKLKSRLSIIMVILKSNS